MGRTTYFARHLETRNLHSTQGVKGDLLGLRSRRPSGIAVGHRRNLPSRLGMRWTARLRDARIAEAITTPCACGRAGCSRADARPTSDHGPRLEHDARRAIEGSRNDQLALGLPFHIRAVHGVRLTLLSCVPRPSPSASGPRQFCPARRSVALGNALDRIAEQDEDGGRALSWDMQPLTRPLSGLAAVRARPVRRTDRARPGCPSAAHARLRRAESPQAAGPRAPANGRTQATRKSA